MPWGAPRRRGDREQLKTTANEHHLAPDVSNESQPGQSDANNSTAPSDSDVNQTEANDSLTNASTETNEQPNNETNVSCIDNIDCAPGQLCVDELCSETDNNDAINQSEALAAQAQRFNELCRAECEAIVDCQSNYFSSVEECISIVRGYHKLGTGLPEPRPAAHS